MINGLLIQLTRKCPLECTHCYVSASPREKTVLDDSIIESIIIQYTNLPNAKRAICLTGGDPFFVLSTLEKAVNIAYRNNFFIHVNTSAFFGKTIEMAKRYLHGVKNISQLEISVDREHFAFNTQNKILNVIKASMEYGIDVQLALQYRDKDLDFVHNILKEYPNVSIYIQNFAPVGERNLEKYDHPDLMPTTLRVGCGKVGLLFVDENARVFPCTSGVVASLARTELVSEFFSIGDLRTQTLKEVVNNLNCLWLRSIKEVGPTNAMEFLEPEHNEKYPSYCHQCISLATRRVFENANTNNLRLLEWAINGVKN